MRTSLKALAAATAVATSLTFAAPATAQPAPAPAPLPGPAFVFGSSTNALLPTLAALIGGGLLAAYLLSQGDALSSKESNSSKNSTSSGKNNSGSSVQADVNGKKVEIGTPADKNAIDISGNVTVGGDAKVTTK